MAGVCLKFRFQWFNIQDFLFLDDVFAVPSSAPASIGCKCAVCSKLLANEKNLKRHMLKVHGQDTSSGQGRWIL